MKKVLRPLFLAFFLLAVTCCVIGNVHRTHMLFPTKRLAIANYRGCVVIWYYPPEGHGEVYNKDLPVLGRFWTAPYLQVAGMFHLIAPHWLNMTVTGLAYLGLRLFSSRQPKGHCQGCGYDLTGNESGACPECNAATEVTD